MEQGNKHVCIFELERKDGYLTGDVVCTACGVKLSSHTQIAKDDVVPEHQRHP